MMSKLAARDSKVNMQFQPQIYQSKRIGQSRNFYDSHNYDRGNYQNRYISNSGDRRSQFSSKVDVDKGINKTIGEKILEPTQGHIMILKDRIIKKNIEVIIGMKIAVERGRSRSRERSFLRNNTNNNRRNDRSISNSRSRS